MSGVVHYFCERTFHAFGILLSEKTFPMVMMMVMKKTMMREMMMKEMMMAMLGVLDVSH